MTWKAPRDRLLAVDLLARIADELEGQPVRRDHRHIDRQRLDLGRSCPHVAGRHQALADQPSRYSTLRATMRLKWVSSSRLRDSSSLMSR
jgi:hypothetical protein